MIQKPQLFDDDSAVSPVIGVILMVAITVILAAVIATFVLGLGEQVSDTTPNANFQGDWADNNSVTDSDDTVFTITHQSGDRLDPGEIRIGGNVSSGSTDLAAEWAGDSDIRAGDTLEITLNNSSVYNFEDFVSEGDEVQIIYDTGDTSSILRTFEAPRNYSS